MRRFRFNLERILSIRSYREQRAEIALAEITGTCVRIRRSIEEKNREKAKAHVECYASGLSPAGLAAYQRYTARLDYEIKRHEEELGKAEEERSRRQREYLEVSKERKVLDKLRERREAEYLKSQRLDEIEKIDDINSSRYAGKGVETWQDRES